MVTWNPAAANNSFASFRWSAISSMIGMDLFICLNLQVNAASHCPHGDFLRKHRGKGAAAAIDAVDEHAAALRLDQLFGQREAQTGALKLLGGALIELFKGREEPAEILGPDADAAVLDLEAKIIVPVGPDAHGDAF